jgi:hypothetical protein
MPQEEQQTRSCARSLVKSRDEGALRRRPPAAPLVFTRPFSSAVAVSCSPRRRALLLASAVALFYAAAWTASALAPSLLEGESQRETESQRGRNFLHQQWWYVLHLSSPRLPSFTSPDPRDSVLLGQIIATHRKSLREDSVS